MPFPFRLPPSEEGRDSFIPTESPHSAIVLQRVKGPHLFLHFCRFQRVVFAPEGVHGVHQMRIFADDELPPVLDQFPEVVDRGHDLSISVEVQHRVPLRRGQLVRFQLRPPTTHVGIRLNDQHVLRPDLLRCAQRNRDIRHVFFCALHQPQRTLSRRVPERHAINTPLLPGGLLHRLRGPDLDRSHRLRLARRDLDDPGVQSLIHQFLDSDTVSFYEGLH